VYAGDGHPGPSQLQQHSLMCLVEQLLREARACARGSLLRQAGLSDGLMRQLKAFLAAAQRWPQLLDFAATVRQVPPRLGSHQSTGLLR
jgi:hypothetical protein